MGESIKRSPFFAWEDEFINVTLSLSQQVSNQVIKHLNNWLLPAFKTLKCFFCIIHVKPIIHQSYTIHMFNNSKSRQKYSFALGNLLGKATFAISWIVSFKEGKKFLFWFENSAVPSRYYDKRDAEDAVDALNGRQYDGRELRISIDAGRPGGGGGGRWFLTACSFRDIYSGHFPHLEGGKFLSQLKNREEFEGLEKRKVKKKKGKEW